eukprot:1148921-Pelagomonas_calceolata.AAC.5
MMKIGGPHITFLASDHTKQPMSMQEYRRHHIKVSCTIRWLGDGLNSSIPGLNQGPNLPPSGPSEPQFV